MEIKMASGVEQIPPKEQSALADILLRLEFFARERKMAAGREKDIQKNIEEMMIRKGIRKIEDDDVIITRYPGRTYTSFCLKRDL